jgi:GT2 family glycosyltransferase
VSLSVSLVTYHSPLRELQQTLGCLSAAVAVARAGGIDLVVQLQLVDHSTDVDYCDNLRRWLAAHWPRELGPPDCHYLPENPGYGSGHNRIIRATDSQFHLVINPDVELAEDALLEGLSYLLKMKETVLVAPLGRNRAGEPQFLCKRYPTVSVLLLRAFAPDFLRRWMSSYLGQYEYRELHNDRDPYAVVLVSGCCMLIRSEALRHIEGFSDDFFMYFEDFDLSLRLRDQGTVACLPAMKIVHHGGRSAQKGWAHIRMFVTSGVRFFNRHGWKWI